MDQLAKSIYFVLIETAFLILRSTSHVVWNWITTWIYWYGISTFGILVLDSYVGIMALYWWIDRDLLLCPGLIVKDHGYEIEFWYNILRWISN